MSHISVKTNKKNVSRKPDEGADTHSKRSHTYLRTVKKIQNPTKSAPPQTHGSSKSTKMIVSSKVSTKKTLQKPLTKKMKRSVKKGLKVVLLSPAFHSFFRVGTTAVVVAGLLFTSYSYISKSFANEVVISQGEIIARIGQLTELPDEEPDQIVRVQDETALRHQNPFYQDVKEGDYIIMYKRLAVIYDLRNDVIVAIKRTK